MYFLIYLKSVSTVDHSTLLPYSLRQGFERFTGIKILIYIYILIRSWLNWLRCGDFPAYWGGLLKYNYD
jgi:hypothetical protein